MKRIYKIIFIFIPFVIIILYTIYKSIHYQNQLKNKVYYFPIDGFDPRDLIRGHFIQFRVKYNDVYFSCKELSEINCGCIEFYNKDNIRISIVIPPIENCSIIKNQCKEFIQVECTEIAYNEYKYQIPITKYYFPEKYKNILLTAPENAYIGLIIDNQGKPLIKDLYILNNKNLIPILEYLNIILRNESF